VGAHTRKTRAFEAAGKTGPDHAVAVAFDRRRVEGILLDGRLPTCATVGFERFERAFLKALAALRLRRGDAQDARHVVSVETQRRDALPRLEELAEGTHRQPPREFVALVGEHTHVKACAHSREHCVVVALGFGAATFHSGIVRVEALVPEGTEAAASTLVASERGVVTGGVVGERA
jgi:hypothetical protein